MFEAHRRGWGSRVSPQQKLLLLKYLPRKRKLGEQVEVGAGGTAAWDSLKGDRKAGVGLLSAQDWSTLRTHQLAAVFFRLIWKSSPSKWWLLERDS